MSELSPQKIVLASNNKGKLAEFSHLFTENNLPFEFICQADLGIEDAVEDGLSFVENAIIKARHASKLSGLPAIADDSGLSVPILNGAPAIYSARYAQLNGVEGATHGDDVLNNQTLLNKLLPFRNGSPIKAQFVCVLVMVRYFDDPLPIISQGLWQGEILPSAIGEAGFGYDPLFWLPELNKSSAELTKAEKNKISHRGLALADLVRQLDLML